MGPLQLTAIILGSLFLSSGLITWLIAWLSISREHPEGDEEPSQVSKSSVRLSLVATALIIGAIACGYIAFGTGLVNRILDFVDKSHTALQGIIFLAVGLAGAVLAFRTHEDVGTWVGFAIFSIGELAAALVNFFGIPELLVYVIGPGSIVPAVLVGWATSVAIRRATAATQVSSDAER